MNYKVNWSTADGVFAVPDSVADSYIKLASGKAVKVLIYIMRHKCADTENAEAIAECLDKRMTADDVEDAFSFWEQVGVIQRSDKTAEAAVNNIQNESLPPDMGKNISAVSAKRSVERSTKMLSAKEIAERVNESEEIAFLLKNAEVLLGKALNNTEQRTLIWIHDYYSMGSDIILMIADLCKSINKANIGYIEKIASSWSDAGISTHEQAEMEIMRLQNYYSLEGQVAARLGLNRGLTSKEKDMVSLWAKNGITIELIEYAYEKTVNATGKAAFSYMNKILSEWNSNNLHSIEEIDKFNENYTKNKKRSAENIPDKTAEEHSYNLNLLLQNAINNVPTIKEK